MTKVLFLTESFHPVLGGGERHVRELATRLVAAGDAATVVTRRSERDWPAEESLDGVRVRRVGPSGPARLGKYLMVPAAVAALLRERAAAEVIVVRGTRVLGVPALVAGRLMGRPVVLQAEVNGEMSGEVYTWGTPLAGGVGESLVRALVWVRNRFFGDADAFVAMSRPIEAEFLAAGMPRERVVHLPHGVDTGRFRPATAEQRAERRRALGLPESAVVIASVGRLLRGKGLETLLSAFESLAATRPDAHLLLVGSGAGQSLSIEAALRERAAGPSLAGRVTMPGRLDDVEAALQASDVFAFPSEFEALGLALIEAAACGLPAVGSRTGGIVDVIEDGRTGILCEPGDVAGWSAALAGLVADAARRRELGERARQRVLAEFDAEASARRYLWLFRELARGASPASVAARGGPR